MLGARSVRRGIMLILGLLVALFIAGMWLMSSLNLGFAQQAMSDLRQRQIADTFYANLDRINAHHQRMEQHTAELAHLGELLYRQRRLLPNPRSILDQTLREALGDFPEAFAAGLWFQTATLTESPFALYAWREGERIQVQRSLNSWYTSDWYQRIIEPAGQPDDQTPRFNWTPAYYKAQINNVVISLSTLMYDDQQTRIGMASTDWRADQIIRLVSRVEVTPGAFAFLIDSENRNLSSLAQAEDIEHSQRLMDTITASQLHQQLGTPVLDNRMSSRQLASPMQTLSLVVDDEDYALFFSLTQAGMVFGIGVPQVEIDAVLAPMRQSNLRIVLLIGSVLLLLSGWILYLVAGTLRQLHTLYTDSLTRLPNRSKLLLELEQSGTGSLILLNLDAFKEINDFYGHQCGDYVIRQLARALGEYLDSVPGWNNSQLYRMPADEIAIWLPGQHGPQALQQRLTELQNFVSGLNLIWQGQDIPLHASLGLASSWQTDGSLLSGEQLLTSANMALKLARINQRHFVVYDPAHRARETYEHNLTWANRLKLALEQGRIVPYFQPIMELKSGRIEKFECLTRMLDGDGEPVSPGQFLAVSKRIRLYRFITRSMVEQCFQRFAGNDYEFSLNLSCEDLLDTDLTRFILEHLQNSQIARRVIFEILESEGIENYTAVRQFIDQAKALGCRIAIDDFGTGYSNFEHLLRLNVDMIKIDGSLIRQLGSDPNALTLTRGIVRFARELGIQTVAEFVHSPQVLKQVRDLGIDFAQGASIGMPSAELITRIEAL